LRRLGPGGLALALTATFACSGAPAAEAIVSGQEGTFLLAEIRRYRAETWGWQRLMGKPLTPATYREQVVEARAHRIWLRDLWRARAAQARREARRPPHRAAWRCIHGYEGSWSDPGAPYYGGLQMDLAFQRTYGLRLLRSKGTANRWTPLEQMWTAERALRAGRGFYPWPAAAHRCGLL
jgi:hypothetical protein